MIDQNKPPNFHINGNFYLVRCFACDPQGKENWAPAVASGRCAWCGWPNKEKYQLIEQCTGTIVAIGPESFEAKLVHDDGHEELDTFLLSEIPNCDQQLIQPGAVFYLSIGHETSPSGQKRRVSDIRMRRLP